MSRIKMVFFLLIYLKVSTVLHAQTRDYFKYLDTVNVWMEENSFGPVLHLKRSDTSFGEVNPKPYHLIFNFNYAYIKDQFLPFMRSIEKSGYLDSLLIDHQISANGGKKSLYLGVDVPFELQSAIITALLEKIGIVDEVVLLKKGRIVGDTREIIVGGGWCPYVEQQLYLRRFNNIRQLAQAKNKTELLNLFESLNEGYSKY